MIKIKDLSLSFKKYSAGQTLKGFLSELFMGKFEHSDSTFKALNEINLEFTAGDRVGLIGRNGAGKSTLLKTIAGIYAPTSGSIEVNGRIVPLIEIGAGFNPEFSAVENIYLNGAIMGCRKKDITNIKDEVLDFAELQGFSETPVKYFSTGMYMKLAFSIATSIKPDILILDEIFAGGDAQFVKKAEFRMTKIIQESNIMLMVSHDNNLIRKFCNRVIWIEKGAVFLDGKTEDILLAYESTVTD